MPLLLRPWAVAENPREAQRIPVDEIGRSVQLVGQLGIPLGEQMEITGYWHNPKEPLAKDSSMRFTVTVVNGKTLSEPFEFNQAQVVISDHDHHNIVPESNKQQEMENQVWTLIAYETGHVHIVPDESRSKTPVFPAAASPYYTQPFTSQIVGVLQRDQGRLKR